MLLKPCIGLAVDSDGGPCRSRMVRTDWWIWDRARGEGRLTFSQPLDCWGVQSGTQAGTFLWVGGGTVPLSLRGRSQEAARPESGKGRLRPGRHIHIRELFITGVASNEANEVTLRGLVESVEARSLSLSHSHLALGRRTDGEGTGMDVMSGGGSQGDRGEQSHL